MKNRKVDFNGVMCMEPDRDIMSGGHFMTR